MNPSQEVRIKGVREYFKKPDSDTFRGFSFYRDSVYFNPLTFLAFTCAAAFAMSFRWRLGWVILISELAFILALFLRFWKIAQSLKIRRVLPAVAFEYDRIEIAFEITNLSGFNVSHLSIEDVFTGTRTSRQISCIKEPIPPGGMRRAFYQVDCDAGMGAHPLGPALVRLEDPLGWFEFKILLHEKSLLEVLPKSALRTPIQIPASQESQSPGITESANRGRAINFFGVREYHSGDPFRWIHWKLSEKHGKLLVKEFERSVYADVTIALDLDAQNHVGRKDRSTWEYAKDIAVALIQRELQGKHRFQLLSQDCSIPFGKGDEHARKTIRAIHQLMPIHDPKTALLDILLQRVPKGSTLILITPFFESDSPLKSDWVLSALQLLKENSIEVSSVLLDARSFATDLISHPVFSRVLGAKPSETSTSNETMQSLLGLHARLGIPAQVVKR